VAITVKWQGEREFIRTLSKLERYVLPRAQANTLNRTATRARKESIADIAKHERRKKKSFRSIIRVTKRARARISMYSMVGVFRRENLTSAKLSDPFYRNGIEYRRVLNGRKWTERRPRSSSPNLPVFQNRSRTRDRREQITMRERHQAMRHYYPGELRKQIDKAVASIRRRIKR
jgi:hypothetical protein